MTRKSLGNVLPPVTDILAPTDEELNRISALWDSRVPAQWRGLLDAKPIGWEGTPKPRFYYDEVTRVITRASNGKVVTARERRLAYLAYQKVVRGK